MPEHKSFRVIVRVVTQALTDNGEHILEEVSTQSFDESAPIRELVDYINGTSNMVYSTQVSLTLDGYPWGMKREPRGI